MILSLAIGFAASVAAGVAWRAASEDDEDHAVYGLGTAIVLSSVLAGRAVEPACGVILGALGIAWLAVVALFLQD